MDTKLLILKNLSALINKVGEIYGKICLFKHTLLSGRGLAETVLLTRLGRPFLQP